ADVLAAAGLPPEMLRAAASTLARWNDAKDGKLTLTDALDRLAQPQPALMPSLLPPAAPAAGR
ncbi:hypothetical protein NGM37_17375, partial [Streptomyces sp. TRM76130]|nr:hypothetical protein [Streptomyces sp. TRM76130]